jgi:hypothetical protein
VEAKSWFYDRLVVRFGADERVALLEFSYDGSGGAEVMLNGLVLTARLTEDVLSDLAVHGYTSVRCDIGYNFHAGFSIWSMGSIRPNDVIEGSSPDDERDVVEGVSVAPFSYWAD